MVLFLWIVIFIASLALLVKSADLFVVNSEKIGLALKISPFIIGVTIVAIGTSFPELSSAVAAVMKGSTEIVVANIIGSNIANIFLIIGISSVIAKRLIVKRSLIDLDAPLLVTSSVLFLFIIIDKKIVALEGALLLVAFIVYVLYTIFQRGDEKEKIKNFKIKDVDYKKKESKGNSANIVKNNKTAGKKLSFNVFFFLILGGFGLAIGANYTIESVLKIAEIIGISASLITITAVAIGTSLPELVVSVRAATKKKYEIALGNVFGSNVFNILLVGGIPALIKPLEIDELTFKIGIPFFVVATLIFSISVISRKIHIWEGLMYTILYILFICNLIKII